MLWPWGFAWLIGLGLFFLRFGPDGRVFVDLPTWLLLLVLMGLAIGYSLQQKAAVVVAQVLFFPLTFGGGLMSAPGSEPAFVAALAPYLPTGGAVRLMWAAVGDYPLQPASIASLIVWIVLLGAFATWAYRRDEGQRFS